MIVPQGIVTICPSPDERHMPQLPTEMFPNGIRLQGHNDYELTEATNTNNFFNMHMAVINAEQLQV